MVNPQLSHLASEKLTEGAFETSENNDESFCDPDKAPDGGLRAWLTTAGTACTFFAALGFANSFGVFEEYYLSHQLKDEPADKIAWIGSLSAFLQFATGAVGGPLFDRYGAWIIRPAAILYVFSLMMTSLCEKYWQFMLAQGILLGVSMGLLQFPSMAAVMQYFDKNIAAALGIAVAGSSIGGVVIPIALSKMLNSTSLGFGWSVRIIAFVVTPLLAFSCLTVKARLPPRKTTFYIPSAFTKVDFCLLVSAMFFMFFGLFTPLFYIPTYAVSRGMDATLASYLLAILNAASTFGRVIPGVLADRFGRLNVLTLGGTITGIIIFCMNKAESNPALIVYSIAFGFWSGTIISGASAALSILIPDPRVGGTYLGMALGVSSMAALIGPPVNGALVNKYHGFSEVSILSGTTCVLGALLALVIKTQTPQGLLGRV
ncbi:hypothetical protein N7536_012283 [Penicillium majusculum]|uniref:Major facilitator superfamily (MFS) profile domain-containing protein n=1 Tax=Penicillium solitum TaxID=60172 RepID=A0A1V6QWN3_9EURO|nr:uncharacterized protein PENSOL_c031G03454 [Penicillium solitum]KAJ5681144.1 hypothetical protein N7536_012283 [Penicillium majusculum]OQD93608.1 hypothetical protein PENSOL_c031G03454 [Penicillium solitum]